MFGVWTMLKFVCIIIAFVESSAMTTLIFLLG